MTEVSLNQGLLTDFQSTNAHHSLHKARNSTTSAGNKRIRISLRKPSWKTRAPVTGNTNLLMCLCAKFTTTKLRCFAKHQRIRAQEGSIKQRLRQDIGDPSRSLLCLLCNQELIGRTKLNQVIKFHPNHLRMVLNRACSDMFRVDVSEYSELALHLAQRENTHLLLPCLSI